VTRAPAMCENLDNSLKTISNLHTTGK